nr:PREDICTED: eukaryotic translation initiation factor 2-alpha kinase-like [Bemisia tabaci]
MASLFKICLKFLTLLCLHPLHVLCRETSQSLPFCDYNQTNRRDLILVNTLDGKITALDPEDDGATVWKMSTSPGHMLSSSIHQLKLYNHGNPVEVIPSLSGSLYKYNGKNVEPIPVAVSSLLKSSYQYTDRYSGSEESRQMGVVADTGELLYECSADRCGNYTYSGNQTLVDILEIRRFTQTVRGFKPRSGEERWNFSVAQIDIKLLPDPSGTTQCILEDTITENSTDNFHFKAVVPEGIVCAVNKVNSEELLWKHQFDSPVVSMWSLRNGKLERIDLFEDSLSLYLGTYKEQWYIQESSLLQAAVKDTRYQSQIVSVGAGYTKITLQPVAPDSQLVEFNSVLGISDQSSSTALSVLYAPDMRLNKSGFYAFSQELPKSSSKSSDNVSNLAIITEEYCDEEEDVEFLTEDDPVVQIIIVSIWYWWKEIALISLATAVAINFIINWQCMHRLFFRYLLSDFSFRPQNNTSILPIIHKQDSTAPIESPPKTMSLPAEHYVSRYLTDFDPIHCLGKGGFGVVFEAKNKIDDCHYAIKRIPLPNKQESRDRVMREVKALAKLDHRHIVRYFNAWVECPPVGWQESQDEVLCNKENYLKTFGDALSIDMESSYPQPKPKKNKKNLKQRKKNKKEWLPTISNKIYDTSSESSLRVRNDKSDSFIVFETSAKDDSSFDKKEKIKSNHSLSIVTEDDTDVKRLISKKKIEDSNVNIVNKSSKIFLYIQMQLCRKESLREWLHENTEPRNPEVVLDIFEQIVQAVEYVHLEGLIHRDLKPSNIFFSPNGEIKIGDFGLVTAMDGSFPDGQASGGNRYFDERHTAMVGTQLYMSPEQVHGNPYNYKVDIYSLGLILFELLIPFSTQMERWKVMTNLRRNVFPKDFRSKFKKEYNILNLMLSHSPEERPTTIGIRALYINKPKAEGFKSNEPENWYFQLPAKRRTHSFNHSSSNSENSGAELNEFPSDPVVT